jgi:hypothetical protein
MIPAGQCGNSDLASVVEDRIMPPWKAAPHFGVPLKGDKSLSEQEIATIVDRAEAGAPEGNRVDLPTRTRGACRS